MSADAAPEPDRSPDRFIERWRASSASERSNYQMFPAHKLGATTEGAHLSAVAEWSPVLQGCTCNAPFDAAEVVSDWRSQSLPFGMKYYSDYAPAISS